MSPRKKPTKAPEPEPKSRTREGFSAWRTPSLHSGYLHLGEEPKTFNGAVNVYRYRVTIERIEEPEAVIVARMIAEYQTTDNMHTRSAIMQEAQRMGLDPAVLRDRRDQRP